MSATDGPAGASSRRGALAVLFVTLFNSILGLSILFPVLAPLGRELGLSELEVGSLSTAYALAQLLFASAWGRRSERIGRKPVLLSGILGFSASFFGFALLCELGMKKALVGEALLLSLLGARLIGGAFSSATLPTAQAYIADSTQGHERTSGMALVGAAFGLGVVFGPALGGVLAGISLLAPVYFSASLALLNALFVAVLLPESPRRRRDGPPANLRRIARRVWPLLCVSLSITLASVVMEQTIAFHFQDRLSLDARATARSVGWALVGYGVAAVFVQGFVVRRFRWSPLRLLSFGLPILICSFLLLIVARDFSWLTTALVLQGLAQGFTTPGVTAALSLGVTEDEQGSVAGLNSSAQAVGRLFGPVIGTALYQLRPEFPYMLSAALAVLAAIPVLASRTVRKALRPLSSL